MIQILSLYNPIPGPQQSEFEKHVERFEIKKGEYLLLDGETQDQLYLVREGLTMMYKEYGEKKLVLDFAYRNRFSVDLDSFRKQSASNYSIICMEDCTIEAIKYDELMGLFDQFPAVERAYRILSEQILVAVLSSKISLSTLSIQERFHKLIATRPELFSLVPHKHIASYLNIDPTNFSKLYNACIGRIMYR